MDAFVYPLRGRDGLRMRLHAAFCRRWQAPAQSWRDLRHYYAQFVTDPLN